MTPGCGPDTVSNFQSFLSAAVRVPTRNQDSRETQNRVARWYPAIPSLLAPVASPPGCWGWLLSPPAPAQATQGRGPLPEQHPAPLFPPRLRSHPPQTASQSSFRTHGPALPCLQLPGELPPGLLPAPGPHSPPRKSTAPKAIAEQPLEEDRGAEQPLNRRAEHQLAEAAW